MDFFQRYLKSISSSLKIINPEIIKETEDYKDKIFKILMDSIDEKKFGEDVSPIKTKGLIDKVFQDHENNMKKLDSGNVLEKVMKEHKIYLDKLSGDIRQPGKLTAALKSVAKVIDLFLGGRYNPKSYVDIQFFSDNSKYRYEFPNEADATLNKKFRLGKDIDSVQLKWIQNNADKYERKS